jgi:hypothetical protein
MAETLAGRACDNWLFLNILSVAPSMIELKLSATESWIGHINTGGAEDKSCEHSGWLLPEGEENMSMVFFCDLRNGFERFLRKSRRRIRAEPNFVEI